MSGKDLQSEIRALLGQIGLEEGADEASVLERFKGREPPRTADEDDTADFEGVDDDGDAGEDEGEEEQAPVMTPKERRLAEKQAKKEQVAAQNAAAVAKAAAAKAKLQPAAPVALAAAKGKQAAAAPATGTVVSLSRPKAVKEEAAPRKGAVKTEDAEEGEEEEDDASAPRPVQAKDAFPLNNVIALPSAAPPKTIVAPGAAAHMKWWQQAAHVTLSFPPPAATAVKGLQGTGKKVSLAAGGASGAGIFLIPKSVDECVTLAHELLASVVAHFESVNSGRGGSSDSRWMSTVMSSGTLSDKIAGMTLMVQEAPLYRLGVVDALLAMAKKQGRRENQMASEALKDLFLNDLLPPRKMNNIVAQPYMKQQAALAAGASKASLGPLVPPPSQTELVYYALEESLKSRYLDFLSVLETGTHDEMPYVKKASLGMIFDLLCASAEREKVLLALLVNKLGDSDRKIGSRVVFLLSSLTKKHPAFKLPLIAELEQLLYRAHISPRAQYYALIFMNQMIFVAGDEALANKLITVYFLLFKQFLLENKKAREEEQALMEKKRAKKAKRALEQQEAGHHHPKPKGNKAGKGAKAPVVAPKKYGGSNSVSSKFAAVKKKGVQSVEAGEALRSKLLGGLLTGINRALPYASQMAVEGSAAKPAAGGGASLSGEEAVLAQIDMLFTLVHTTSFATSIQALMLLYQVLSRSIIAGGGPNTDRFFRALYEKLLAPEVHSSSSKHGLFLNLLYKSLKNDSSLDRVAAFVKRLLQVCLQGSPAFQAGVIFLLSEVLKVQKGLAMMITQPQVRVKVTEGTASGAAQGVVVEDDEEEHFRDVPEEGEEREEPKKETKQEVKPESTDSLTPPPASSNRRLEAYDPSKRDPLYAQARSSCLWELLFLARHFHPSVVRFAEQVLSGQSIAYSGDPLKDFTNMAFLDRFCFKNPKKAVAKAGGKDDKAFAAFTRPKSAKEYTPANTPAFLARAAATGGHVGEDQQFLLQYFTQKSAADKSKKSRVREGELGRDATEEEEDAFADDLIEREMRKVEPDGWMGGEDDDIDLSGQDDSSDEDGEDGAEEGEEGEEDEFDMGDEGDEEALDFEGDDAPMDEIDDEAAAEAEALAEMEAGGGAGDSEEEMSADDDDDDDEDFPLDSDDDDDDDEPSGGRDRNASVFASAEEFADLLNAANDTGVSVKQSAWEKRSSLEEARDRPRGGRQGARGGKGGKGGAGAGGGGYKSAPKVSQGKKDSVVTPEKPSFKRKLAEARGGSHKKGSHKGGKHGGKKQRR